jgi:hypothetical protein
MAPNVSVERLASEPLSTCTREKRKREQMAPLMAAKKHFQ